METAMVNAKQGGMAAAASDFDKSFDDDRAGYLKQVNDFLSTAAGVRYLDVANSIHPGAEAWKDAYDRGVPVKAFVEQTMQDFGFVRVGKDFSREEAGSYNKVKAAMCEFSMGNGEWTRGNDGTLFNDAEGGVAMMKPVRDRLSGKFGFGIEFREGAVLDALRTRVLVSGKAVEHYAGLDMGKALNDYAAVHAVARRFEF